jgi:hypothetical protein
MSLVALDQLEARHEALIDALDRNDLVAITEATQALGAALDSVKSHGSWTASPELKRAADRIGDLADAAAMRLNVLADQARRRAEALALARGKGDALTYTR